MRFSKNRKLNYMRTAYTQDGLLELGRIINTAKGELSVRAFARKAHINYQTINRLIRGEVREPEITTLEKLAPHLGRDKYQLIAICEGRKNRLQVPQYSIAEDVLPIINQLSDAEAMRVAQAILARLAITLSRSSDSG
jgi:transcriptional regulator with XRE-family HTH domain